MPDNPIAGPGEMAQSVRHLPGEEHEDLSSIPRQIPQKIKMGLCAAVIPAGKAEIGRFPGQFKLLKDPTHKNTHSHSHTHACTHMHRHTLKHTCQNKNTYFNQNTKLN